MRRFYAIRGFPVNEEVSFTATNDAAYSLISLAKDIVDHLEDREHAHSAAFSLSRKQESLINQIGREL